MEENEKMKRKEKEGWEWGRNVTRILRNEKLTFKCNIWPIINQIEKTNRELRFYNPRSSDTNYPSSSFKDAIAVKIWFKIYVRCFVFPSGPTNYKPIVWEWRYIIYDNYLSPIMILFRDFSLRKNALNAIFYNHIGLSAVDAYHKRDFKYCSLHLLQYFTILVKHERQRRNNITVSSKLMNRRNVISIKNGR